MSTPQPLADLQDPYKLKMLVTEPILESDVRGSLPLLSRGKVRDLYEIDENTLLFVTTDRISAYDVILDNGVPHKGHLLTLLTSYWFKYLKSKFPTLRTHLVSVGAPDSVPEDVRYRLENRSMIVRKFKVFPIEAIVRGYLAGSAWKEYKKFGTVHGITLPEGLKESDKIPGGPIFTPSTKAEQGGHDENIHPDKAAELVGAEHAAAIGSLAVDLYKEAAALAEKRGLIIADTKFEFGLDTDNNEIVLIDEVLTPDSSRFWLAANYTPGKSQESFDKQFLRDWLVMQRLDGQPGVRMPEEIATATSLKYMEAYERITGERFQN
ncbi:Bifunctional purine biosynthetic protein ade1 [Myotisia sp. PD_48]|nr:Bifunctional purine biosynthetic protein ade1 [Myotisia sp. PD_48]